MHIYAKRILFIKRERELKKKEIEKNGTNRQTNKQEEEDRLVPFRTMVASTTEAKTN